ncbi:MAG TPA: iron export ABC transporter permease subunit FetB [Acidimicrobiales bacterium]|nr:iron export ABC transporter permease subunit FetB [Acidimicrobiales bacterium]
MNDLSGAIGYKDVALAVALVAVGMVISRVRGLGLEKDMAVATIRSFVQLLAVGYVLEFVFDGHGVTSIAVLAVMVVTAALTAGRRARAVPGGAVIAGIALGAATAGTLGVLTVLGIVPVEARAVVPLGSMVLSNAMISAALVMTTLRDDLAGARREVEARLSLGQTAHQASLPWHRRALRSGMLPVVENTKVVGLVALPGAMTGMILAGAQPLEAIRLQLVVMYMLLGGNAFAAVLAGELTVRRLFTSDHQLIRDLRRKPA